MQSRYLVLLKGVTDILNRVFSIILLSFLVCFSTRSSVISIPSKSKDLDPNLFPYVGGLRNRNGFTSSAVSIYGGKYALTTRHSVTVDGSISGTISSPTDLFFVVRENDTSTLYQVKACYPYDDEDLVLLEMQDILPFGAKISKDQKMSDGDIFYGVGYGLTASKPDEYPPVFDKYEARKKVFKNRMVLDDSGITFDLSKKETLGKDGGAVEGEGMTGLGDSGGGVFVKNGKDIMLVGILESSTMNSDSDGEVVLKGYAIRVNGECLKWIETMIKNAIPSSH